MSYDKRFPGRCGHPWCRDCAKRRGRNRGNRNARHAIRLALRTGNF